MEKVMSKPTTFLVFALTIICLVSCKPSNPAGLWFYTHSTGDASDNIDSLTPASFIDFHEDGSYTKDFGKFEYGHWQMKDNKIILTDTSNKTADISVKYLGNKDLQLLTSNNSIANFEAQPDGLISHNTDPFSLEYNRWRIPAKHKESEQEIRSRLRNHCRFWEAYFSWALENKIDYIDVRSTPTPIKIYGNGFSLKDHSDLPKAWRMYFFDDEDCRIANNILYELFQFKSISWPHTDNKYKMFLGAFQQMQQLLK
jgi:hypothetical protein